MLTDRKLIENAKVRLFSYIFSVHADADNDDTAGGSYVGERTAAGPPAAARSGRGGEGGGGGGGGGGRGGG